MIDAHSHLENEAFDNDREEIIARMEEDDLDAVVNVGSDIETSRAVADLAKKHDRLYAVVGVHPKRRSIITVPYAKNWSPWLRTRRFWPSANAAWITTTKTLPATCNGRYFAPCAIWRRKWICPW